MTSTNFAVAAHAARWQGHRSHSTLDRWHVQPRSIAYGAKGRPFESAREILERRRGGELFRYLLETFASFSGISGAQPKILMRDEKAFAEMEHTSERLSQSYKGATHIVKLWEPNEYQQLAANEYFCLTAARKCGLEVPPFRLAADRMALVIDRFDLRMDGTYRGFEDFCVLNARRTDEKYRGSYEKGAPGIAGIGQRMLEEWGNGSNSSLREWTRLVRYPRTTRSRLPGTRSLGPCRTPSGYRLP